MVSQPLRRLLLDMHTGQIKDLGDESVEWERHVAAQKLNHHSALMHCCGISVHAGQIDQPKEFELELNGCSYPRQRRAKTNCLESLKHESMPYSYYTYRHDDHTIPELVSIPYQCKVHAG